MKILNSFIKRNAAVVLILSAGIFAGVNANAQTSVTCSLAGTSSVDTCTSGDQITVSRGKSYRFTGQVTKVGIFTIPRAVFESVRVGIGAEGATVVHRKASYGFYEVNLKNNQLISRRYKAQITNWRVWSAGDTATLTLTKL